MEIRYIIFPILKDKVAEDLHLTPFYRVQVQELATKAWIELNGSGKTTIITPAEPIPSEVSQLFSYVMPNNVIDIDEKLTRKNAQKYGYAHNMGYYPDILAGVINNHDKETEMLIINTYEDYVDDFIHYAKNMAKQKNRVLDFRIRDKECLSMIVFDKLKLDLTQIFALPIYSKS